MLIDRENYEKYSNWKDADWDVIHMGNGAPDAEKGIATGADVLVVDAIMKIGADIIEKMPGLKLIHSQGVAFNGIDTDAARKRGIYVCNNAGVNAGPVAEQTVLLILALLKSFRYNEDMVYADRQMEAKMACFRGGQPELAGLSVGIVGFGAIGRQIAALLKPFSCKLYYYTRSGDCGSADAAYLPLEKLYAECDIISLNAPVTPETTNMINGESLKLFKRGALLINTARGELMDHKAVVGALISGQLGGLGTDVLAPEPYQMDNPVLCDLPKEFRGRVALSPHIAGITADTFRRAYAHIRQNIEAVAGGGRPGCIVNGL
jgi:lactate dehydrogenase-like 2-hydroxyacid dehydrogenase